MLCHGFLHTDAHQKEIQVPWGQPATLVPSNAEVCGVLQKEPAAACLYTRHLANTNAQIYRVEQVLILGIPELQAIKVGTSQRKHYFMFSGLVHIDSLVRSHPISLVAPPQTWTVER